MYFAIAGSPGTTTSSLLARFKRCNIESVPPQIEVDVEGSINDTRSERIIDYTKLRNLLASENWKYADLETRSIILQLTHREEKGWLDIESVYNLPYPSLCIINELWLKYSHGHFGFSVQKHIWEDVKESEKDFGYKVGWSVLGKWIYHYNLTFSLDAPPGHLPFWGRGWSDQRQWVKEVQIGRWADALLERYDLS
ncbi:hypothetical protein B4U84_29430 [Westiellopsis prolifica IICB1]|nr:hypothetical protein B4U84_29430 [Westiellopsis prolifica IICB1]